MEKVQQEVEKSKRDSEEAKKECESILETQVQQYQENLAATQTQLLEAQQEIQAKTAQLLKQKDDQLKAKVILTMYYFLSIDMYFV